MRQVKSIRRGRTRNMRSVRRGAAVVEFAVVSSVFFAIVLACIQFNRVNMIRNLMQDAAYFAARKAMVPGALMQDAVNEANAILALAGTQGATVTVNGGTELSRTSSQVSVTITVPLKDNAAYVPYMKNQTLSTTATMKTERYDKFYNGAL
jgi:Flp pilus assembly protein TadG